MERENPSIDSSGHRIPPSVRGTATLRSEPKLVPRVSDEGCPGHPEVQRDIPSVNSGDSDPQSVTENSVSMETCEQLNWRDSMGIKAPIQTRRAAKRFQLSSHSDEGSLSHYQGAHNISASRIHS